MLIGIFLMSGCVQEPEPAIEKMLQDIHTSLKEIKQDFPQLSDVDQAELTMQSPTFKLKYEKGLVALGDIGKDPVFQKNGVSITVEIVYPDTEIGEPPTFSMIINNQKLSGMVFVDTEKNKQGTALKNKVIEIVRARVFEMGKEFGTEVHYFG